MSETKTESPTGAWCSALLGLVADIRAAVGDPFGFMAYITTKYCTTCDRDTSHTNGTCNNCRERIRREEMAAWQAKTVEEKLLDLHKRTLKLEAGPARY